MPGRALLPHVFTLAPKNRGGLFSVALAVAHPHGAFPLGSRMPCAARTFLPEGKPWSGRTFCCCEDSDFSYKLLVISCQLFASSR